MYNYQIYSKINGYYFDGTNSGAQSLIDQLPNRISIQQTEIPTPGTKTTCIITITTPATTTAIAKLFDAYTVGSDVQIEANDTPSQIAQKFINSTLDGWKISGTQNSNEIFLEANEIGNDTNVPIINRGGAGFARSTIVVYGYYEGEAQRATSDITIDDMSQNIGGSINVLLNDGFSVSAGIVPDDTESDVIAKIIQAMPEGYSAFQTYLPFMTNVITIRKDTVGFNNSIEIDPGTTGIIFTLQETQSGADAKMATNSIINVIDEKGEILNAYNNNYIVNIYSENGSNEWKVWSRQKYEDWVDVKE